MAQLAARPAMGSSAVAPQLVKMPLEVIQRIAYFLPTSDLCLLRLTCKAVESSVFIAFTREFFAKKQFMLSEFSLQTLVNISKHPTLGPSLTHLIIGLDRYPPDQLRPHPLHTLEEEVDRREAMEAQRELLNTGRASAMLAQALRNLRGLQTIDIRDFNSPSRWRDGGATWSSYGATVGGHYRRDLVIQSAFQHGRDIYVDRVFKTVLVAMAESGIELPNLEVVLKDRGWGLAPESFSVRPWLAPSLHPVLANLQRLHLAVNLSHQQPAPYAGGSYQPRDPASSDPLNASLRNFLRLTPNLLWLRLNFQNTSPQATEKFLTWLGQPASAGSTQGHSYEPAPISLPLQQLDLGVLRVRPVVLQAALVKFAPTLKAVNLWDTALTSNNHSDWDDKVNLWAKFFISLANSSAKLQSLMIGRATQIKNDGYRTTAMVSFGTFANGAFNRVTRRTSSEKDFLLQLAKDTTVTFPEQPRYEDDDEDDDEDEDEEGEGLDPDVDSLGSDSEE